MELKWRISHARGYLQLGMFEEAMDELDAITGADAKRPEVRTLRVAILQEACDWKPLRKIAGELASEEPGEIDWWIIWAFASRRAVGLEEATRILIKAEAIHPEEATIQFNLGCYACQRGDMDEATSRVSRALLLDGELIESVRKDPDLEALRAIAPGFCEKNG